MESNKDYIRRLMKAKSKKKLAPLREKITLNFYSPAAESDALSQGNIIVAGNIFNWTEMKNGQLLIDEDVFSILLSDGHSAEAINKFTSGLADRIRKAWRSMDGKTISQAILAYDKRNL